MDDIIDECLKKIVFKPPLLKKFVDDIIVAIPSDRIEYTLDKCHDKDIQFTIETEDHNKSVWISLDHCPFLRYQSL